MGIARSVHAHGCPSSLAGSLAGSLRRDQGDCVARLALGGGIDFGCTRWVDGVPGIGPRVRRLRAVVSLPPRPAGGDGLRGGPWEDVTSATRRFVGGARLSGYFGTSASQVDRFSIGLAADPAGPSSDERPMNEMMGGGAVASGELALVCRPGSASVGSRRPRSRLDVRWRRSPQARPGSTAAVVEGLDRGWGPVRSSNAIEPMPARIACQEPSPKFQARP